MLILDTIRNAKRALLMLDLSQPLRTPHKNLPTIWKTTNFPHYKPEIRRFTSKYT